MRKSDSRKAATTFRTRQIRSKSYSPPPDGPLPQFVADVMLGRLAKWLRIAGFDVLYSNRFTDDELVALSQQEARILLSRDTRLLVRKVVTRFIFLESEQVQSQLKEVFAATRTKGLPGILTRCLACNEILLDVPRESVQDKVPPFVFQTQSYFKSCPACSKIYWAGTHRDSVLRILEKLLS